MAAAARGAGGGEGGRGLSGSGALLEELSGHHNGGTWIAPLASSSLHLYF
jgi:hypothetical protein